MNKKVIIETNFKELGPVKRGKVRDVYDLGKNLLIVSSDRISAFDVILPNGIPNKGFVLNQVSRFWFDKTSDIISNHLITTDFNEFPEVCKPYRETLEGRSMLVKKARPLPVECIVRGYLSGSGLKEYQKTGMVSGIRLPEGLLESSRIEQPIFTPSTKAEIGEHDENITFEKMQEVIGPELALKVKDISINIYKRAVEVALTKGIIIADTKFEFGMDEGGRLILIDEALTPDSSRFWPLEGYAPGRGQESYDKQFVRDYLLSINWETLPKVPELPEEVVRKTSDIYMKAYNLFVNQ
ncbi:MAG: phosphoribosylaminoimidazolesuccinocarboxamide synthase [Deltaproteobacteria bacterium]|nr:phosphoribosylaminoimidazolesuccinocarboxamide synthase [Deltaproteobacteria bacterium]